MLIIAIDVEEDIREELGSLVFYRYLEKSIPQSAEAVFQLIHKYVFFLPEFIWLKGKMLEY